MTQRKPPLILDELTRKRHDDACEHGLSTYTDPHTGYSVITQRAHEERGKCCGSKCRHCPYDWINVPNSLLIWLVLLFAAVASASAQWKQVPLDTVKIFATGEGQRNGQGLAFFPANVLSGPSSIARDTIPATDPREICSLGLGGTITLGLRRGVIVDGPGADFTVFENAFRYGAGRIYAEPATVEVSRDGITWTMFPFDSADGRGLAGTIPTTGQYPYDPQHSGGNSYDLADIALDSVRWVRITDVTPMILSNPKSPLFDPTLTGFDLDVVLALHALDVAWELNITPILANSLVELALPRASTSLIMDVTGRIIDTAHHNAGITTINLAWLPRGWYYVIVVDADGQLLVKVLRS